MNYSNWFNVIVSILFEKALTWPSWSANMAVLLFRALRSKEFSVTSFFDRDASRSIYGCTHSTRTLMQI